MPRMIDLQGDLYDVPDSDVAEAIAMGFKVMSNEDMARMHNRLFLAQKFFEQKHPKMTNTRLPRGKGRW